MDFDSAGDISLLLGSEEVPPVLEVNAAGRSPFLLTCDHYGRTIPRISEATVIPGNEDLGRDAAEARRQAIFDPYHRRIGEIIDRRLRDGLATVLVSLHS